MKVKPSVKKICEKCKIIKRKGEGDVHYLHIPQYLTREITRINPDVVIAW